MRRIIRPGDLRPDARRDVSDELRFHLDMRAQEFIEQGLSPEDARRAAAEAFGDVHAIDAELRGGRESRDHKRARQTTFSEVAMDVRFALRTLRKNAGFTLATLATLALGIGAATAVFTVVNGVLLRPLPYPDPSRLAMVWMSSKQYGEELPLSAGFYGDIADRTSRVQSLATTAAFRSWGYSITSGGEAEQITGARVTPTFFSVVGTRPMIGRIFTDADAAQGASHSVILSYELWRRSFGADGEVVGKTIDLSGEHFTVVGVMPEGFAFPRGAELPPGLQFGQHTELWTPMGFTPAERRNYGTQNLATVARLKPGATIAELHAALDAALTPWLAANAPKLDLHYQVSDLKQQAGEKVRGPLLMLLAAVALLLCIACANVVNLLLARTVRRRREFAVRAALGAGSGRMARQLVTENVLLAAAGSLLGVALSVYGCRAMLAMVPGSMPRADDVGLDWRVALAVTLVTIVAGIAFGLAASTQTRRSRLAEALREDGARTSGGRRTALGRRTLVVAEVSLSLMLLIGAALLTVSFARLQRIEPGFDPSHVLTGGVSLPVPGNFDPVKDGASWARFFRQLQDRVARMPGVEAAGAISVLPLGDAAETGSTATVGEPPPVPGKANPTEYYVVEGEYFRAMRIPLLAGRAFLPTDDADAPHVVVVNREYERKYLGGHAMGKRLFTFFDFARNQDARTIVGVVENVQSGSLDRPPVPQTYVPEPQMPYPFLNVVVRTRGEPMAMLPALKHEVKSISSTLAVSRPRSMQAVFDDSLAQRRFSMTIIGFFAAAALALAMVGLYGVIALSVSDRSREIGVRMALGARAADVMRLVLNEALAIAVLGVVIGIGAAYAGSRLLASLLYGVSARDAGIYAAAAAITVLITVVATLIPARRATKIDPTRALRGE
jgi:predicted permease